jgi:transposase
MTRQRKPYQTYTKEFKQEAVRLMIETDRPATEIARELGLRRNQLYKWKEQIEAKGSKASPAKVGQKKKTRVKSPD